MGSLSESVRSLLLSTEFAERSALWGIMTPPVLLGRRSTYRSWEKTGLGVEGAEVEKGRRGRLAAVNILFLRRHLKSSLNRIDLIDELNNHWLTQNQKEFYLSASVPNLALVVCGARTGTLHFSTSTSA